MTHIPPSSILLPSGYSNFFDTTQYTYDINTKFPSPDPKNQSIVPNNVLVSGIYKTYPKDVDVVASGRKYDLFQPSGLNNLLSNHSGIYVLTTNLGVFNSYIHYYGLNNDDMDGKSSQRIEIPYVSTFKVSLGFDPYPRKNQ